MGNANVRDAGDKDENVATSSLSAPIPISNNSKGSESASMIGGHSPPDSPGRSRSPVMFASQVPVAPLPFAESAVVANQQWTYNSSAADDGNSERGIPTLITWSYGGNDVAVEGSWDNWTSSRKNLHRAGKDFTLMMVLPSGVYHYKFIVDGEWRYVPDLPWMTDDMGNANNILDVKDYVPENLESVSEFESPLSPEASYDVLPPSSEDFSKEPPAVPPHLHLTLLNVPSEVPGAGTRPQHVILNHLYVEKARSSQSVLALGLTHRFLSKYVTVVLYKPFKVKTANQ